MPTKEEQRILQKKAQDLTGMRTAQMPGIQQVVIPDHCPECGADIAHFILIQPLQVAAALGSKKKPAGPLTKAS